ncbi:MAG: hypothetical protein IH964_03725 [Candidatus Dadabacteria bacterium]|nr:hypothetical protein [Candidatus Dadabacteria bacterium]
MTKQETVKILCFECGKELRRIKDSKFARKIQQITVCEECMLKLSNGVHENEMQNV